MDDNSKHASSYQHDQEILDARGINMTVEEVAGLPTCKYTERVQSLNLNEDDLMFLKGLRRRIRNRLASQNSRRRSMENLRRLTRELRAVRACRDDALTERRMLLATRTALRTKYGALRTHILKVLQDRSDPAKVPDLDPEIVIESPQTDTFPCLKAQIFECRIDKLVQQSVNHIYKEKSKEAIRNDKYKLDNDTFTKENDYLKLDKHDNDKYIKDNDYLKLDKHGNDKYIKENDYLKLDKHDNDKYIKENDYLKLDKHVNNKYIKENDYLKLDKHDNDKYIKDNDYLKLDKHDFDNYKKENDYLKLDKHDNNTYIMENDTYNSDKHVNNQIYNADKHENHVYKLYKQENDIFTMENDKYMLERHGNDVIKSERQMVCAKTVFIDGVLNLTKKKSHGRKQSAPRRIAYVFSEPDDDGVLDLKIKKEPQ